MTRRPPPGRGRRQCPKVGLGRCCDVWVVVHASSHSLAAVGPVCVILSRWAGAYCTRAASRGSMRWRTASRTSGVHLLHNQLRQRRRGRVALAVGVVPHRHQRLERGVEAAGVAQVDGPAAGLSVAPPRLRRQRTGLRWKQKHAWGERRSGLTQAPAGRRRTRRDSDVSPPRACART